MDFTAMSERIEHANAGILNEQAQAVDAMKSEMRGKYDTAQRKLPEILKLVKGTQAWMHELLTLASKSRVPLPRMVEPHLKEIATVCENCPRQVREGIAAYEGLKFQQIVWKDGRSIYLEARASLIHTISASLQSWDGMAGTIAMNRGSVERILEECNWPSGHQPAPTVPAAPFQQDAEPLKVETAFEV
ncbi:hypothetical protein W02_38240 [Nitrospira sp. KM1]|uniref:hypothetical protein n=1 Tax=Nitrospira sp. KM1 TaxID=1936990 RepID=UPI0013A7603B|nr:hypothetical protein [Nitrospira sp. KM1]BCA56684.1 hypothetical protein W02_38240 [Nitrospira sp. KM1]